MENKPSYKTTAFILIVVNILLATLAAIQQYIPASTAAIISACLTAIFVIVNAWLKIQAPPAPVVPPAEPVQGDKP